MILGISASGRENGITGEAVKAVLEATEQPYEFVSLAGLQINGCRGCTGCAGDNHCVVQDDWLEIGEKMRATAIKRTALILVGPALGEPQYDDSRLYAADFHHASRPKRARRSSSQTKA